MGCRDLDLVHLSDGDTQSKAEAPQMDPTSAVLNFHHTAKFVEQPDHTENATVRQATESEADSNREMRALKDEQLPMPEPALMQEGQIRSSSGALQLGCYHLMATIQPAEDTAHKSRAVLEEQSAVKIQARVRGALARRSLAALKHPLPSGSPLPVPGALLLGRVASIQLPQPVAERLHPEANASMEDSSARRIQAALRGKLARKKAAALRSEKLAAMLNNTDNKALYEGFRTLSVQAVTASS